MLDAQYHFLPFALPDTGEEKIAEVVDSIRSARFSRRTSASIVGSIILYSGDNHDTDYFHSPIKTHFHNRYSQRVYLYQDKGARLL